jgi:hypothetical protein
MNFEKMPDFGGSFFKALVERSRYRGEVIYIHHDLPL